MRRFSDWLVEKLKDCCKRLFSVSGWRGAMLAEVAQHLGVTGGDLTVVFHVLPFAFSGWFGCDEKALNAKLRVSTGSCAGCIPLGKTGV